MESRNALKSDTPLGYSNPVLEGWELIRGLMRFADQSLAFRHGTFKRHFSKQSSWLRHCVSSSVIFVLLILFGCDKKSASTSGLPMTTMQIGSKTFTLEIAADDDSRHHGLMERDELDAAHGMIFLFPKAAEQPFYMHHTRFPLDIIFAGADSKVISVSTMKAYDESNTYSNGPAKYAIELYAGMAKTAGVKAGDQLTMPPAVANSEIR